MQSTANTATPRKRYRVAQWATGNVGARALRRAIEHPDLDVVGVWVHGAHKVGRDAGELAGVAPIGVAATNNIDEILALKPDCVLYMPHVCNYDEICRILESGANVVTTRMELQNIAAYDPVACARIEEACRRGNSSIHATGSSPVSVPKRCRLCSLRCSGDWMVCIFMNSPIVLRAIHRRCCST
jgi:4-hydroxy-tetrahydrodipicolinate reductase